MKLTKTNINTLDHGNIVYLTNGVSLILDGMAVKAIESAIYEGNENSTFKTLNGWECVVSPTVGFESAKVVIKHSNKRSQVHCEFVITGDFLDQIK